MHSTTTIGSYPRKSRRKILTLAESSKCAAEDADLTYVNDAVEGICRKKKGSGFSYYYRGELIKDEATLNRIRTLAIPPAWVRVWICAKRNGHLQATGYDVKNRKQYRYHAEWSNARNQTKYHRLKEFGKSLPRLRTQIEKDIAQRSLTKEKVLATVLKVMERTCIRVGNSEYEKLYGSYGLTTMKDGHVNINGSAVKFSFRGKKGIFHTITLQNKRLAKIVKACRDIPGKELFQYFDEDGIRNPVDSGMVNEYIRNATGGEFTAKDLRTWSGSLLLFNSLRTLFNVESEAVAVAERRKHIQEALNEVCSRLGNTRTVCKKYYVHPALIDLYENNKLQIYFSKLASRDEPESSTGLMPEEKVLLKVLQKQ